MKNIKKIIINILIIISIFVLYFFLPTILIIPFLNKIDNLNRIWRSVLLLGIEITTTLIMILLFIKPLIKDIKSFKFINLKTGYKCWLLGLVGMVIANIIITLIIPGNLSDNEEINRSIISKIPLYALPTMAIFGPICEEIVFRLSFKKLLTNRKLFLIITSIIFASAHLLASFDSIKDVYKNWTDLLYFIPYFSLALSFSKAYYDTDNIITSILVHITHNTMCLTLILVGGLL